MTIQERLIKNARITIISIWSKHDAADKPKAYTIEVPRQDSVTAMLEAAFEATNIGPLAHENHCPSTSVGDMMNLAGQYYFVDSCGFKSITEAQAEALAKLTSRDVGMGWNWLVQEELIPLKN